MDWWKKSRRGLETRELIGDLGRCGWGMAFIGSMRGAQGEISGLRALSMLQEAPGCLLSFEVLQKNLGLCSDFTSTVCISV